VGYVRDRRLTLYMAELVAEERDRQEAFVATGKFAWTCADETVGDPLKLAVLTEEMGEVGRALCEGASRRDLRDELIHVAAVAVAWAEAIGMNPAQERDVAA
jgi:NTP pyrophosphatase (non-canonical NTP hydrolase)